jgi:hypothetical protein
MPSDAPPGSGKQHPFNSAGISSMAKMVEMEQDLLAYAPLATLVEHFEGNRLDQGMSLSTDFQMEHLEGFHCDWIL